MTEGPISELRDVLDRSLAALRELVRFEAGAIHLLREEAGLVLAAADPPASAPARTAPVRLGRGPVGTIAATGEPLSIPDAASDPARAEGVRAGARSFFGVPLMAGGETIGVLHVDSPDPGAFSPEVQERVLALAPLVAGAVRAALLLGPEREALQRLRDADRLRTELLSLISHELKTPLTFVLGTSETLATRAGDLDGATIAELAGRMRRASGRMDRIIDDLLEASRIERQGLRAELRTIAVEPVVRQVVLEAPADREISVGVERGLPEVTADPDRLAQVLTNLLSNAVKFSQGRIDVAVRREGDEVAVAVRDEGPGIPRTLHERVFSPFFRGEPTRKGGGPGMGIGLYLVNEICRVMGATLSLESDPGRGSTFTVRLPAARS